MRDKNWRFTLGQGRNPFSVDKHARKPSSLPGELLLNGRNVLLDKGKMMPRLMNIDEWTCTNLVEARQSKLSEAVTELLIRVTPPSGFPLCLPSTSQTCRPPSPCNGLKSDEKFRLLDAVEETREIFQDTRWRLSQWFPNMKSMAWYKRICDKKRQLFPLLNGQ